MTQVLTAQVLFPAKEFDTQFGPRLNAKIKVVNGEEAKLWGPPGDGALLALRRGQTIQIAKDGKGKYSLVEQSPVPGQAPVDLDDGVLDGDTKSAIASYISNRAALYSFCYQEASRELEKHKASEETVKCAASTLFIAAQKKFGI